ncbi:MAG: hypothetical protein RL189_1318, partial [Pseudomonadota bacterium]
MASSQAQKNLTTAIGEQNRQLVAVMVEADNALRAELSKKISEESDAQAQALQAFKREVDATYAKQVDLIALQGVVNGLSNALNILDRKVDDNDKRLTESVKTLRSDLTAKIDGVQANVESLRGDFKAHVTTYTQKVAELAEQTRAAARQLREEMASAAVHSEAERTKLQASIENLAVKLTNTEDFAIKTRDALTGKIVELERRDSELSNEVRDARNAATSELSAAIAKEQQARQAIADDVKKLQAEVERVSQVAGQALALSKANELAIAGVQADLKEAEQRWKTELATLRGDMEKEMGDLRAQSQLIMRGLGLSAQSQFAETATQLADLKGKVAGLLSEMGRALEKGVKLSSDPVIKDGSAERAAAFIKKVSQDLSQTVLGKSITLQDLAAQRIDELSKVLGRVETEFLLAIDYGEVLAEAQKTADLRAMNDSFIKDVVNLKNSSNVQVCAGASAGQIESGIPVLMASVNNEEFWAHLARAYSQMLLSGSRTGNVELDKIFHGTAALADGQSFQSALAMSTAQSMAAGAGGECISRVNDWAKSILFGSGEVSVRLRNALAARNGLKNLLTSGQLQAAYKGLESPAASIESVAKATLLPAFGGDEAKVTSYLRSGNVATKDPGFFATASQIIHEYTTTLGQRRAVEANLAGLTEVAKEANNGQATSQALQASVEALKEKLAKFEKLDERVNKIASGTATSFGLIAAMATRMGFSDIVDKAKSEATKLADIATADPSLFLPMGCKATSHFFNFANEGQPLQRCDSGVSTADGNLGDNGRCRTTQTNTTTVATNVNTHTHTTQNYANYQTYGSVRVVNTRGCNYGPGCYDQWYNMGSITSYLGASSSTSQQVTTTQSTSTTFSQAIVGVLSVPWLSPLDASAQSIMKRAAGAPFPSDRRTMIGLRIFGNAAKWRLEDPETGRKIELNAADFKVADTANGLVYEIPAAMFLAKTNGQAGFTETARVTALTATGEVAVDRGAAAKTCLHSMNGGTHNETRNVTTYSSSSSSSTNYTYGGVYYRQGYYGTRWYTSPLVLDLKPNRKLQTIAPELSNAMFDLQATGMKQRVGWITKDTGLLALDLNNNGEIDNGRELFGDFTKLKSGSLAANGYEALADHDSNKDGVIDSKDRVFKKLVLWMDDNGDGVTQKGELKKLAQVGITGISVKYEQAAADERIQNRGNTKNNLVLFKGRFFGSNCPENGCRSYDVYFGYDDPRETGCRKMTSRRFWTWMSCWMICSLLSAVACGRKKREVPLRGTFLVEGQLALTPEIEKKLASSPPNFAWVDKEGVRQPLSGVSFDKTTGRFSFEFKRDNLIRRIGYSLPELNALMGFNRPLERLSAQGYDQNETGFIRLEVFSEVSIGDSGEILYYTQKLAGLPMSASFSTNRSLNMDPVPIQTLKVGSIKVNVKDSSGKPVEGALVSVIPLAIFESKSDDFRPFNFRQQSIFTPSGSLSNAQGSTHAWPVPLGVDKTSKFQISVSHPNFCTQVSAPIFHDSALPAVNVTLTSCTEQQRSNNQIDWDVAFPSNLFILSQPRGSLPAGTAFTNEEKVELQFTNKSSTLRGLTVRIHEGDDTGAPVILTQEFSTFADKLVVNLPPTFNNGTSASGRFLINLIARVSDEDKAAGIKEFSKTLDGNKGVFRLEPVRQTDFQILGHNSVLDLISGQDGQKFKVKYSQCKAGIKIG